jgi:homoserine O-succinyltransferase
MPLLVDTSRLGPAHELRADNCITIGLINNMPDAALESTERQFTALIRAAAPDTVVRLLLFAIPEVPRAATTRLDLIGRYHDIGELWDTHLDGLIVTGAEPQANDLRDEQYWPTLRQVVDWARDNTTAAIWSCLAAHAAVLHSNGVERVRLGAKLCGVFDCELARAHPLTRDVPAGLRVPHSRYNDLPEAALAPAGYRILTRAPGAGVDMFVRQEKSFHIFFQGHPEYEANTLLREYRRDVARFLRHERDDYPELPNGYFDDRAAATALSFRERALADRRAHLIASFPQQALQASLESPWFLGAIGIYAKWIEYLRGRKSEQRPLTTLLRRAWRDWPQSAASPAEETVG